ncbi:Mlo-like protein, partial [Thalictrum thalictroides]
PGRFRYTRQTTFGRRHMNLWTETSLHLWIKCFFRQFFHSVAKVDYLTLRHGFIAIHNSNSTFDFQKYIKRSLEDDFKVVVGISPHLWFLVVTFLLFDVHGWNVYLWLSFVPLVIMLALGTKLEVIVTRMALSVKNQSSVIKGSPLVQPNDELFWFANPRSLLHFLHLTLFLNAFEVAFFIWIWCEFGMKSCYHENIEIILTRVIVAVIVQLLCSYITLPLYALITQMGSQYKSSILNEQTANIMKKWHEGAKRNVKKHEQEEQSHFPSSSHHVVDSRNPTTNSIPSSSPTPRPSSPAVSPAKSNGKDVIEEVSHVAKSNGKDIIEEA